jgi:hypothetical protein
MIRLLRPTVDSIIANITRQVNQLHDAANRHHNESLAHSAEADRRAALATVEGAERDRARSIANKLKDLIT